MSNIDWQRIFRAGTEIVADYSRAGTATTEESVMWALLCDAARVSALAYRRPPHQGYPVKSAMPDAPDEITYWQKISAYLQGEALELPTDETRPPHPGADAITRAEAVLHIWHNCVTLGRHKKRAVYIRACGGKPGLAHRITGLSVAEQKAAKRRAVAEMLRAAR